MVMFVAGDLVSRSIWQLAGDYMPKDSANTIRWQGFYEAG